MTDTRSNTQRKIIGREFPSEEEFNCMSDLENTLRENGYGNSDCEKFKRNWVIRAINSFLRTWYHSSLTEKPDILTIIRSVQNFIKPMGSFTLGVVEKTSTLDLLCLAPREIRRDQFFKAFASKLDSLQKVRELALITKSSVPVISFYYSDVHVNLFLSNVEVSFLLGNKSIDNVSIYNTMDKESSLSFHGYHIAKAILQCITQLENFNLALSALKLWAKNRGLDNSKYGYLGEMSLTILLLKICQSNENAVVGILLSKFFKEFATWKWPLPVKIKNIDVGIAMKKSKLTEWDPLPKRNVVDFMPIITPAFPQQNLTSAVTKSTRSIILKEMERASEIMEDIVAGKLSWDNLFESFNFFDNYSTFMVVKTSTNMKMNLTKWIDLLESRILVLVKKIDNLYRVQETHLCPKYYDSYSTEERYWFIGYKRNSYSHDSDEFDRLLDAFSKDVQSKIAEARLSKDIIFSIENQDTNELESVLPEDIISEIF
ncbi:unnamed protein product [Dimorphilus gyrociliatus]|uniref:polynucleotide adenylyltransferase n=1 Tax=Dimorphilus gyrociliatus TaxID=2664684 RepID=A0A7I8V5I6_9ANNE|nr:unnamed protein product [Dimorphilus gyrociliatus]